MATNDKKGHYNEQLDAAFSRVGGVLKDGATNSSGYGLKSEVPQGIKDFGAAVRNKFNDITTPQASRKNPTAAAQSLARATNPTQGPSLGPISAPSKSAGGGTPYGVLAADGKTGIKAQPMGYGGIYEDLTVPKGGPRSFYNEAGRAGRPQGGGANFLPTGGVPTPPAGALPTGSQGGAPRSVLIGQSPQRSALDSAIKDAIAASTPKGTGRGALLKAKAARQLLGELTRMYGTDAASANSRGQNETTLASQQLRNSGAIDQSNIGANAALQRLREGADLESQLAALKEGFGSTQADIAAKEATAGYYGNRNDADIIQATQTEAAKERSDILGFVGSPGFMFLPKEQQQVWIDRISGYADGGYIEGYADGGMIDPMGAIGYADGGPIGFDAQPTMESLDPAIREYSQYVATATKHKLQPVPLDKFIDLMEAGQQKLQSYPSAGGGTMGFAAGGAIPVAGQQVMDQTGTPDMQGSDNIPAVIDGQRPAALTSGEFVIPAEVVKAKGTEFFDKLIAQYMGTGE